MNSLEAMFCTLVFVLMALFVLFWLTQFVVDVLTKLKAVRAKKTLSIFMAFIHPE